METTLSIEQARSRILSSLDPTGTERVFLSEATDRHLAETLVAPEDAPRFANSARDGYAVRWEDLAGGRATLEIVDESAAGAPAEVSPEAGQAIRIATGARVPPGADTVVMQEHCAREGGEVTVETPPDAGRGAWIRPAGRYLHAGETVVREGSRLTPAAIGLLASFRSTRLEVYRRPRVAVVSTGDELVDLDTEPTDGEIVDSNAYLLESLLRGAGALPRLLPIAPDEREAVRSTFHRALEAADLVVSSGGVSVGEHDEVRHVLEELTGGLTFWKTTLKPGKPLAFGTTDDDRETPLLGLPGNPNSCFVCFHQFIAPALRRLQGEPPEQLLERSREQARLADEVTSPARRRHYLAGRLERQQGREPRFVPAPGQFSGNPALFCGCDVFGIVPEGVEAMQAGENIEIERIS